MYRIARYVIILVALLTSFPVKSVPGAPWTWTNIIVLIGGVGVLAESVITIFRKGRIGKLQLVIGLPSYIIFMGNWLFRLATSLPFIELRDERMPHRSGYAAALTCVTLIVLACAVFSLSGLLRAKSEERMGASPD